MSFNFPNMPGSVIGITGAWSRNATWYSGLQDGMWGENGAVNGNGQAMAIGDAFSNGDGSWATPEAWSISAWANFAVSPQVTIGVEGSYGEMTGRVSFRFRCSRTRRSFIVGARRAL